MLLLVFQTDLLTFSGYSFNTGLVTLENANFGSALFNGDSPYLSPDGGFSTGAAAAVPEPGAWAMLLLGFAGLGLAGCGRAPRRRAAVGSQGGAFKSC